MAVALVMLTACGSTGSTASQPASDGAKAAASQGKVLVVYFSATGNTKRVAETIANHENATIFEIKPTEPYSDSDLNYRDDNSRVVREHAQPQLRPTYQGDVADWDSYDTVYIGYPLWWQQAPHVVYTFVEGHNFSGKRSFLSARRRQALSATAARTWPRLPAPAIGRPVFVSMAVPATMTS